MKPGLCIAALLMSSAVYAQPASAPGPYILDVRGVMSGLPSGSPFHPVLPANTLVPRRGFGIGVGAHIYLAQLGPARLGFGVDVARVRGTASTPAATSAPSTTTTTSSSASAASALSAAAAIDTATTITLVAPQVSFNFGTADGWSYLSAGYGAAQIHGTASGQLSGPATGSVTLIRDEGLTIAVNYGGGARWFLRQHLAAGFDVRFHRIRATQGLPANRVVALSVGISIR